LQIRPIMHN